MEQPWLLGNHTRDYFELVTRFGGVEGKFVQDVYPYMYLVRDLGRFGKSLERQLPSYSLLKSGAAAQRLFRQWSLWWDTTKPLLLEKTPENFLMAPFLQQAFGRPRSRFVFVMRHPLVWALAIEKWIFPDFVNLRTVEERLLFWFECTSKMIDALADLRDVLVLQLESVSVSQSAQLAVSRHLLCSPGGAADAIPSGGATTAILSSSLAYITCWLVGEEFKSSSQRCGSRRSWREPAYTMYVDQLAAENGWRLRQIHARHEVQANQLGYTFKPFVALTDLPLERVERKRLVAASPIEQAQQLGVAPGWSHVREALRPFLVVPPVEPLSSNVAVTPLVAADSLKGEEQSSILVVYHKLGLDHSKPTGMDIRMSGIIESLLDLKLHVHFLCHCRVDASQLSFFGAGVSIYEGSLQQQYERAVSTHGVSNALVFFTTFTMSVHARMSQGDEDWHLESTEPLPEERVLGWLRERNEPVCISAVVDDVHHLRIVEVMGRYDLRKAKLASVWVRKRELAFLSAANTVMTVSEEDAAVFRTKLMATDYKKAVMPAGACSACNCKVAWVPYIERCLSPSAVEPFERRRDGMLYVGGMHGLAIVAVEWLVSKVQPAIVAHSPHNERALLAGGQGHLYLAGPGWLRGCTEGLVAALNRSVAMGHATLLGTISDMELSKYLQQHKVFTAPVFNGTGIATKNVLALSRGVPLVTTPIGLNGLGLPHGQETVFTANFEEPQTFAQHVLTLQRDSKVFTGRSAASLLHAQQFLSAAHQQDVLCELLKCQRRLAFTTTAAREATLRRGPSCAAAPLPSEQLRFASDQVARAPGRNDSLAVLIIGLPGSGVHTIARLLHRPGVGCIVADPFEGLLHAGAAAQVEIAPLSALTPHHYSPP